MTAEQFPSDLAQKAVDEIVEEMSQKLALSPIALRPFIARAYDAGYAGRGSMPSHVQERGR